ncbi:UNVERIFIED_CONTAM: Retrovirus-related Pol polyprotein from transposon TNT 1-94 [Sesamum calycinum]|uniref:Retrovirus-related Pol polyprotein from transposon TNT 1-94 n=1 Tax=Sesamum calycinum TaxID=2727403 RepID=A0AAW2LUV7_9LAMI
MCASVDIDESTTYEEAVTSQNANEWMTAMKEEMSSMAKNNFGSWLIFQLGIRPLGTTIVAHLDLELFQMDVKTTFLNGELDEEIYMDQPEGSQEMGQKRKVYRLKRSIYGLKQSSRQWYHQFPRAITSIGFTMVEEDHRVRHSEVVVLNLLDEGHGEAEYILGVKIHRDRSKKLLSLSQETYIERIIERFYIHSANPVNTLMEKSCVLSRELCPKTEEEKKRMAKIPYASAVGSLMYAMMCTRLDLCVAVGMVSRYHRNPGPDHWVAVKRILRYLKETSDMALCYHGGSLKLVGYSDADGSTDRNERKSTSGYVFLLGGAAITWCCKKQPCISLSTMEVEYVACTLAVQEAI